ncbi:MAG: Fic family protein [Halomonas sp.]|nr:Fic family protein [Halomonas sp.]
MLSHPFREGNGRISRLLLDVRAVKVGAQPLDYSLWNEHKDYYFKAIQAGRDGVGRLVRDVLGTQ